MILLNEVAFETPKGFRTIELHEGDLTQLGRPVDVLVLSAYAGSYAPVPRSLIRSLLDVFSLDVMQLVNEARLDFRSSLGVWISNTLEDVRPTLPYTRIIGVEMRGSAAGLGEALDNVFAAIGLLEAKGISVRTMALPLLGTGSQRLEPAEVLAFLLPAVRRAMDRLDTIERVYFVERDHARATAISDAIDSTLQRSSERLGTDEALASVQRELVSSLQRHEGLVSKGHHDLPRELREGLRRDAPRSIELGILGRRLVEFVVDDLGKRVGSQEGLERKIEFLARDGVAPWIRSYMHVLRVFGNEQAHQKDKENRRPPFVVSKDLAVCLFCMLRVWEYWVQVRTDQTEALQTFSN